MKADGYANSEARGGPILVLVCHQAWLFWSKVWTNYKLRGSPSPVPGDITSISLSQMHNAVDRTVLFDEL